jgi:hypothetical protein
MKGILKIDVGLRHTNIKIFLLIAVFFICVNANAQTTEEPEYTYPQWAKDLRRADVVAFGTFPFTWLISSTIMDLRRSAAHGWDRNYYPWPAKPAGAPAMTNEEYIQTFAIAGAMSVGLALVDALIVHIKRRRIARQNENLPKGDPIIIKRQMPDGQVIEDAVIPDRRNQEILGVEIDEETEPQTAPQTETVEDETAPAQQ